MLTKSEWARIQTEIVTELRSVQRFNDQDIFNKHHLEGHARRLLWEAREELRATDGIEFGPIKGWPGAFERKEWRQIEQRAIRQRRKGTRAHKRAEAKLRLAASLAPTEEQQRISDAADRVALRVAMRAARG